MPRKIQPGPARPEDAIEEEELDEVAVEAADPGETVETQDVPRPRPATPRRGGGHAVAPFAIGLLVLFAGLVLLVAGFTQTYYELDVRNGPQPEGDDDDSVRTVVRLDLDDFVVLRYPGGTGDPVRENRAYDEAPTVGILMKRLAWTGYVGAGLVTLTLLAAVLHRFGALTFSGPAPIIGVFGLVLLVAGLVPFMLDIAHHARIEFIPGRLDLTPMFWTANADGDVVHDLYMRPLAGFYLHAVGVVAAVAGTLLVFWGQMVDAGRTVRTFAESAAERLD